MFAKDIDVYESVKLQISHSQDSEDRMFAMASPNTVARRTRHDDNQVRV
jgi:hypothetical protein